MLIKQLDVLNDHLNHMAWQLYQTAFEELNTLAVQRHLMNHDEFLGVMDDQRVGKYLALDDTGRLAGLSTYTNDLDAVPLVSPPFFARHYPEHYEQRRIWYVGFLAVADGAPVTTYGELIEAMYRMSEPTAGISVLDVCARTDQVRHLPRATRALLQRISGNCRMTRLDEQSYWLYEFPDLEVARAS